MGSPTKPYLASTITILAVLAVAFAGLGGVVTDEAHRKFFAAGSGFWLLMLVFPWLWLSAKNWSYASHSAVAAAFGALAGVCFRLCFSPGEAWGSLFAHIMIGGLIGFASYWLWVLRSLLLYRDG
jgi:hypothetical protein